jgi:hypothetical protein
MGKNRISPITYHLSLITTFQFEERDFGQAAVAHGQDDRAEAACDVNLRVVPVA